MPDLAVTPTSVRLSMIAGTDITWEFQLTTSAGVAVDITNDTVDFTVRDSAGGTQKKFVANGVGQHSTPLEGKTRFTLAKADTAALTALSTTWVYEVRRIVAGTLAELVYIAGDVIVYKAVGKGS